MPPKSEVITRRARGLPPALRNAPLSLRQRLRRPRLPRRLTTILAFLGPGLIAAAAGNDAGGIATYSQVGAQYGYDLLWVLLVITVSLCIVQEMSARLGAVTGKGLADLIREEFGVRWTTFAMSVLLIANTGTTISEFAGISAALGLFGVSKWWSVPIMAVVVWLIVVRFSYRIAEKVFLTLSAVFIAYLVAVIIVRPDWQQLGQAIIVPRFHTDTDYIITLIALVGTTITPYMQLFLQSAIVDKGTTTEDYAQERVDVIAGALLSNIVAGAIIVVCAATLHKAGQTTINSAADAAQALQPLVGPAATALFGVGLFGASMLAACILPLSTSYAISEAFGFERGVSHDLREAPVFFGLYTGMIALGAGIVLLPINPISVILGAQLVNGVLLPIELIFILLLVNNRAMMGRYTNGRLFNAIAWGTALILIGLTAIWLGSSVIGAFV